MTTRCRTPLAAALACTSFTLAGARFIAAQPAAPIDVPPTGAERRRAYLGDLFGPRAAFQIATAAGFDQWQDAPGEWRQGMGGFGQRLLSRTAGVTTQLTLEHGIAAGLRHDLRYAPLGPESPRGARLWHAVSGAVLARRADGHRTLAAGTLAGAYGGRLAETAWQPGGASHAEAATSVAFSLAFRVLANVVREFRR